jgi:uncharacterized protein
MSPPASAPPALLRGVDRAAFVVAFALRLRRAGVTVGGASLETFAQALAVSPPDSLAALYWSARITLVRRQADLATFDAVFDAVFTASVLALDPNARRTPLAQPPDEDEVYSSLPETQAPAADGGGLPWVTLPRVTGAAGDADAELGIPDRLPSSLSGLADTPFEELSPADLALLGAWLEQALASWPRRRSRRMAAHPAGHRIALRRTLARSRRTGWEPIELVHDKPVDRPRRVVMLCDVSQSMQAYATAYLHLMRAATIATDAEVFAFSTSLTRLTRVLDHKSPEVAIEQASTKLSDRFGGTRIATNVRALLASHHGGAARGAIVLVASDGWDSDPPADLAHAMARLRRRAYRVIWLNPRAASPGYQPLVGAMAAALPFCDDLLPAHTIRALAEAVAVVGRS